MKLQSTVGCLLALAAALLGTLRAEDAANKTTPKIDPKAEVVLKDLSEHLKSVKTQVIRLSDTIDDVQEDGRKLQFAHLREMTIERPDKLKVDVKGDVTDRVLWLDGKTLTVLDRDKKVYATVPAAETIEKSVDMLQEKFGMNLPGADLLSDDVVKNLTAGCDSVEYVGLGYVGKKQCHHLAFTRPDIDYQLWVSQDSQAPERMVITYKRLPGQPQYTLQVLERDPKAKIDDSAFKADVPKDAEKIEFHPTEMNP